MNKKLYRDGPYEDFFSQGVLVGNILTLAGQIGVDEEGNSPEDIKGQMVICYKNICNVLTHFGGTLENVIDETWFVTNVDECMKNVTEIFSEREKKMSFLLYLLLNSYSSCCATFCSFHQKLELCLL